MRKIEIDETSFLTDFSHGRVSVHKLIYDVGDSNCGLTTWTVPAGKTLDDDYEAVAF